MASSPPPPPKKFEVFLSFRGEDTRNTFVSHLYTALNQRGIITFFDELNLEKGQSITPELLRSIEGSTFAVIIFSKNYASSTWCLDELVKIMECRFKYGQTVIPIFYDVDPSEVRKQNNYFFESFAKHEVKFKDNMEKVQNWKEKLTEASNIAGHDLSRRTASEASCISKIVEEIYSKLPQKAPDRGLVGMEYRVKELSSLMAKEPNDVCFIGIWGMGGIGKTTTARVVYDELNGKFEKGCFLQNVSKSDMLSLQKILLSKILNLDPRIISDEYEGTNMIRTRLRSKRLLLVLDDVNDIKQLESLVGEREWFGRGSRIIITTRDKHLLNEVNEIYKIETLSDIEAIHLFCLRAFKRSHPPEDLVQLSYRVVSYACGLPLALEVLGSYLHGRKKNVWESVLDRLKDAPEDKIFVVLKISFDGLSNIQKEIFLDIACFFRLEPEVEVKRKLDSFGFHPVDGIAVLTEKSLINIFDQKIQMHDLIQEMGWNIIRQKANNELTSYSRLWDPEDIIDVLMDDTGSVEVEGFILKVSDGIDLSGGVFKKMNKLRLLEVYNHKCDEEEAPNYLPNTLRWLLWYYYPAKSLPVSFKPRNLVNLELRCSKILQTPDISGMRKLEVLDLRECKELIEIHPSVGVHKKLIHLNLSGCLKLKEFPSIIQMSSLEILNLDDCTSLKQDLFDTQTNVLQQSIPENLPALWDWESLSNYLCRKQEVLRINLPRIKISNWLYQAANPLVKVMLSPSQYHDKLRGFVICAICSAHDMSVVASNGLVISTSGPYYYGSEHTVFWYIPLGKITSSRDWNEQKDPRLSTMHALHTTWGRDWTDQKEVCLLEVINVLPTTWGIRLVYDEEVNKDISDLTCTNHLCYEGSGLKVCVAVPKIQVYY